MCARTEEYFFWLPKDSKFVLGGGSVFSLSLDQDEQISFEIPKQARHIILTKDVSELFFRFLFQEILVNLKNLNDTFVHTKKTQLISIAPQPLELYGFVVAVVGVLVLAVMVVVAVVVVVMVVCCCGCCCCCC